MGDCIGLYDRGGSSELAKLPIGSGIMSPEFPLTSYLEGPRDPGVLGVQFLSPEDVFALTAPRSLLRKQEWGDPVLWRGC